MLKNGEKQNDKSVIWVPGWSGFWTCPLPRETAGRSEWTRGNQAWDQGAAGRHVRDGCCHETVCMVDGTERKPCRSGLPYDPPQAMRVTAGRSPTMRERYKQKGTTRSTAAFRHWPPLPPTAATARPLRMTRKGLANKAKGARELTDSLATEAGCCPHCGRDGRLRRRSPVIPPRALS